MNDLFDEELRARETEDVCSSDIISKIEAEYKNLSMVTEEQQSRNIEKDALRRQIKKLETEVSRRRNVKNHRRTTVNDSIAEKRKTLRAEIEILRNKLGEIEDEERSARASLAKFIPR
jgi:septal ring factor EnvC (AmiA/AmiB activator)